MYGETEFSDKNMLNKLVAAEMKPGQESKVQVILKLRHGTVNYTLMREQTYRKDYSNRVKGDNTVFDIAIKDANGNTSYVKKSQCESEVKGILPKELSRYFFFDGERIEKMSKDISTGKKATDFAEAVKGLLGLNAMYSAIQHFNPKSRLGVIGSYESSYDSHSNSKIQEYTQTIERCKSEIAKIDGSLQFAADFSLAGGINFKKFLVNAFGVCFVDLNLLVFIIQQGKITTLCVCSFSLRLITAFS